ncbi:hypothetical protein [Chelativorans sp. AA-79]|uniref:hypothetical protein n=1 Tax=Chelativorans sp. AA-79 TaxID=3028735 RepID=UPI0023F6B483|nr:hypothetical protein [Chelativorans sp. AA-79]WEX07192.1 hypothetical protein PVE73_13695 [Chelativorans sp. AA-79]
MATGNNLNRQHGSGGHWGLGLRLRRNNGRIEVPSVEVGIQEMVRFAIDHTFFLNIALLALGATVLWLHLRRGGGEREEMLRRFRTVVR